MPLKLSIQYQVVSGGSIYEEHGFEAQSCKDVLLRGLDDKCYSGDFIDLSNAHLVSAALEQAYVKILRLLGYVRALGSHSNIFPAINRVPPEVLLPIFALCSHQNDPLTYAAAASTPNRLAFSQICRSWRRFALASPSLWTDLELRRPELAALMLKRTQLLPVNIFMNGMPYPADPLAEDRFNLAGAQTLPNPTRVKSFVASLSKSSLFDGTSGLIQQYLSTTFHELETLNLANAWLFPVHCDLGLLEAPRLRHLMLDNWSLRNWSNLLTRNTSCLSLLFMSKVPDDRVQKTQALLLRALEGCPALEALSLRGHILMHSGNSIMSSSVVRLPCLKELTLAENAVDLMTHLHLPRLRRLDIELQTSPHVERVRVVSAMVNRCLDIARWSDLRHVELTVSRRSVLVEGNKEDSDSNHKPTLTHSLAVSWRIQSADDVWEFLRLPMLIIGTHLTSLTVGYKSVPPRLSSFWVFVSTIPTLATLSLARSIFDLGGSPAFMALVDALCLDSSFPPSDPVSLVLHTQTPASMPFPGLQILKLHSLPFLVVANETSPFVRLLDVLERRGGHGHRTTVTLTGCDVLLTHVEHMQHTCVVICDAAN